MSLGLLVATVLVISASAALAQEDASARVEPSSAEPGEDLSLVFEMDAPELAEVVVDERVTCTVTFPDGSERTPCDGSSALVSVRTTGSGGQTYAFAYQAPDLSGTYEVAFEAESTARVLPASYNASTTFEVDANPPSPQADGGTGPGDPADDPGDPPGDDEADSPGDEDPAPDDERSGDDGDDLLRAAGGAHASRLMVSTTLATGVLAVTIVANRFPPGGRWR